MHASRRGFCASLPWLLSFSAYASDAQSLGSFIKPFDQLPRTQNGANSARSILDGMSHAGDHIEVHETTLAPGSSPHAPHQHAHEELFLMQKGQLQVTIAGKTAVIGAGGAAFVHSGELHGVHNNGTEPAQYFVVAFGV